MSNNSYEEMIRKINEAQMELKIRLEQVSKLRVDCVKLQLELLKLYRPQCLEILEMLQDISGPVDHNGGAGSRDNDQGNEVLRANEDVSKKDYDVTSRQDQISPS